MLPYAQRSRKELSAELQSMQAAYAEIKAKKLSLNMDRGKPGAEQLDLSLPVLDCVNSSESCKALDGSDCRNYGLVDGIPEAKRLFAGMLGVAPAEVIIGGNSSLNMMYDAVARSISFGVMGATQWAKLPVVKFHLRAVRHRDAARPHARRRAGYGYR